MKCHNFFCNRYSRTQCDSCGIWDFVYKCDQRKAFNRFKKRYNMNTYSDSGFVHSVNVTKHLEQIKKELSE